MERTHFVISNMANNFDKTAPIALPTPRATNPMALLENEEFEHSVAKESLFLTFRINHYIRNYFLKIRLLKLGNIKL
jgi:hypothetical protein